MSVELTKIQQQFLLGVGLYGEMIEEASKAGYCLKLSPEDTQTLRENPEIVFFLELENNHVQFTTNAKAEEIAIICWVKI